MPKISAYRLKHVARVYAQEPGAVQPFTDFLINAGVEPSVLTDQNSKVELAAEAALVTQACDALKDQTFAARTGLATPGSKTLLAYLANASATVGQVFGFAQKYYALEDPHLQFKLLKNENGPIVALESAVLSGHQAPRHRELLVFGMYKRVTQIAGPDFGPLTLHLDCNDQAHCKRLSEFVSCEIVNGQSMSGLQLPRDGLSYPIPTFDSALLDHLQAHGDARLEQMPRESQSLSEKVVAVVRKQLPGHLPSGDEVAEQLFMTRRTLTRRLGAEGTSYKALAEAARCDIAKRLLIGESSIAQVAFLLDFSDQAAFSVAFKRWTGTTPALFKRSNG